jgi:hypothetical protein
VSKVDYRICQGATPEVQLVMVFSALSAFAHVKTGSDMDFKPH